MRKLLVPMLACAVVFLPPALAPVARAQAVTETTTDPVLARQIKDLQQQVKDGDDALHVEQGKTNALSEKALELEKQLMAALAAKKELEGKLADANAKVADLTKQLADANARIAELTKELADANAKFSDLTRQLAELRAQEKDEAARLARLGQDLAVANAAKAADDQRIHDLEAQLLALTQKNGALQATVDATKDALEELRRRKAEADAQVAQFRALVAKFKTLIDAGKLKVKIVDGRMEVELATDILFASGSAKLSRDGREAIVEVARVLQSIEGRQFQVEGHTDDVPIHTAQFPSNWELAAARAITVVQTMIGAGLSSTRVSAASFADTHPALPNDSKEHRAANRRIAITLLPDLTSLPGFDELSRLSTGG